MFREPSDVLERLRDHLSTEDLQLILLYFSQDGRDSWFALEVFEWMQKVNKVDNETWDLMMSIMAKWLTDLVERGGSVDDVRSLLRDMICVGLRLEPDIVDAIVSSYWDRGKKGEEALQFVSSMLESEEILREAGEQALAFLILKMVDSNDQREAMKLVARFRDRSSKLPICVYNAALLAALSEQHQLTRILRELGSLQERGKVGELDATSKSSIEAYERGLHEEAERIAGWALELQGSDSVAPIHEKLLAMYCVAGRGLEAERMLWRMKLAGRNLSAKLYNTVVGICAYSNLYHAGRRVIDTMKADGVMPGKTTYSALFGGFVNGGHAEQAIHAFIEMLDRGFRPDREDVLAVMRQIPKTTNLSLVFKLGERLAQSALVDPFFVYLHIDRLKLSILITF